MPLWLRWWWGCAGWLRLDAKTLPWPRNRACILDANLLLDDLWRCHLTIISPVRSLLAQPLSIPIRLLAVLTLPDALAAGVGSQVSSRTVWGLGTVAVLGGERAEVLLTFCVAACRYDSFPSL